MHVLQVSKSKEREERGPPLGKVLSQWIFFSNLHLVDPFAFSPQCVVGFLNKYHHRLRNEKLTHYQKKKKNNSKNIFFVLTRSVKTRNIGSTWIPPPPSKHSTVKVIE